MKLNFRRFASMSIVILLLSSTLLMPSTIIRRVESSFSFASEYTQSGLVPSGTFQFGGDDVITPSERSGGDGSYIAAKGDLTIKETDLSIPGRGMSLTIGRVYTTPAVFEGTEPYGYESPPIGVGRGWTLNFPWIGNLLHLWDGTCYELEWSGNVFENHQGEHFKLVRESDDTYTLYLPSGLTFLFDTAGKLETMQDMSGNKIRFAYADGLLVNITETVGRVVHLSYSNSELSRISYDGMTVDYTYSDGALVNVKDVQGRYSYYEYDSYNTWLLTKAKYPEGGYKTYSYTRFSDENEGSTYHKYKIASEKRYDSDSNLVNAKVFAYRGGYSNITSSVTRIRDGNAVEKIRYSFAMDSKGRTENFTILDIANAQTQENSESHSGVGEKFTGDGHWENDVFKALYIDVDGIRGPFDVDVGPFKYYPGTSGYKGYETSVNVPARTITVTTYWSETTAPKFKKILYTYNSRNEVIQQDVYVGDTDTLSYSTYRRYDDWGNLVYSRNAIGHERFYSYANTETSGVFVDCNGNPNVGFSNLFYSNTVPSNIHSALLGGAELQDNETSIENYVKYDSNGNEIESRSLFGNVTSYIQFSGTFDESEQTSFSIDLTEVDVQGNAMLEVTGILTQDNIEKSESHSATYHDFDGTGYWRGRYFKAHFMCFRRGSYDEGYVNVGPFDHYPGTLGYKRYTTSVTGNKATIKVTTYYNVPVDRYPAKVDYYFNGDWWKTIADSLGSGSKVKSILPSELTAGINTLYFRESSSYTTKFSWELYVPIYAAPKEDLRTQFTYDSYGNVVSTTEPEGAVTIFEYGSEYQHAYCTKTINTVNGQNITASSAYYFSRGLMSSVTDPYGYVTSFEYDNFGRVTRVINPDGSSRITVYDDPNNTITYYDELGHFGKVYYDGLGRTTKTERYLTADEVYSVETFTYNYLDKLSAKAILHAPGTLNPPTYTYECDALGRTVKVAFPDGNSSWVEYDDASNIVTSFDPGEHKRVSKYDWVGRLLWARDYYNCSSYYLTQYEYDEVGNIIKAIDANGQPTLYEYGSLFGSTKVTYCDSTTRQSAFNKIGKLEWIVNRNGDNTTFTYDELHRLTLTTFANSSSRSFVYDKCGRVVSLSDESGSYNCTYDSRGRVIWKSQKITGGHLESYNTIFAYDVANRLVNMTYPNGMVLSYEYDNLNRPMQIRSGDYVFATFNNNVDGTLSSLTYGNGIQTTYAYDSRLRLTHITTRDPNQIEPLLSLNYTYDCCGNIEQAVETKMYPSGISATAAMGYRYDWLHRLVTFLKGLTLDLLNPVESYEYDCLGNRITKTENEVTTTYHYDQRNRLVWYSNGTTDTTCAYDNNGNLLTKTENNETWQYVYDKQNRLCHVRNGDVIASYTYDVNGVRIRQVKGSTTKTTIYSGLNPIYEHTTSNATDSVSTYVYGPKDRIAKIKDNHVVYYHCDLLGSTRLVTNALRSNLATMSYKPFGEKDEGIGVEESFGFNGKEEDPQIGLYYYGARYYDPKIGRFTQPDSLGGGFESQAQNSYVYCRNNPVNRIDPTGHLEKSSFYNPVEAYSGITQAEQMEQEEEAALDNFYEEAKDTETKAALAEQREQNHQSYLESRTKKVEPESSNKGGWLSKIKKTVSAVASVLVAGKKVIAVAKRVVGGIGTSCAYAIKSLSSQIANYQAPSGTLFSAPLMNNIIQKNQIKNVKTAATGAACALASLASGVGAGLRTARDYPDFCAKGVAVCAIDAALSAAVSGLIIFGLPAGSGLVIGGVNTVGGVAMGIDDPIGEGCHKVAVTIVEGIADVDWGAIISDVPEYSGHW